MSSQQQLKNLNLTIDTILFHTERARAVTIIDFCIIFHAYQAFLFHSGEGSRGVK
jgi:hypothetical protein